MNDRSHQLELGRFLRDRRARVSPGDVGLTTNARRRVPGLRREEVATLAGVGVTWYTMLESGTAVGVSAQTLDAIARALRLNDDETLYARSLANAERLAVPDAQPSAQLRGVLRAVVTAPAYIATALWDVLEWNAAMGIVWGIEAPGAPPFNIARRMFLDPAVRALHGDAFPDFARALVAMIRGGGAHRQHDPLFHALIADLLADALFAETWNDYTVVAPKGPLRTTIVSPSVGRFVYEAVTLTTFDGSGHSVVVQVPDADGEARLSACLAEVRG
jgi:transcriptional regulator with XRE-family HTH domain